MFYYLLTIFIMFTLGNALKLPLSRHGLLAPMRSTIPKSKFILRTMASSPVVGDSPGGGVNKKYLQVPFNDKDEVKALGAKWDKDQKSWYINQDTDETKFLKWKKLYLNVPFNDRTVAKSKGAQWDPTEQKWYIAGGASNLADFQKWFITEGKSIHQSQGNSTAKNVVSSKKSYPLPEDAIVILDLDTSGLPANTRGRPSEYTDLINYDSSRVVQLAYTLCDKNTFEKVESGQDIIQSDGFPIPNAQFHGITESLSKEKGICFADAARKAINVMNKAKYIIAHNADFDLNIFKSELFRYAMFSELQSLKDKKQLCSMNLTTSLTGLLDKTGKPKKPSLKELVSFSLKEELPNPHNAIQDVEYVRRSLQQLVVQKLIAIPPREEK
jgi:DNA polymerase III epsilon subunit-like protein